MQNLGELIMAGGILAVVAIFGVVNNDKSARPTQMKVCLANQTVVIWSDQWQECFKRYPLPLRPYVIRDGYEGPLCGPCGKEVEFCPKINQDPTCVAVEGRLPLTE